MAIGTYAELKSAVASWIGSTKLTTQIPDFIDFAERRFNRELRDKDMVATKTATLDEVREDLPIDFLEPVSLAFSSDAEPIAPVSASQFPTLVSGQTGTPRYFAVIGNKLRFEPVPAGNPTVELVYYQAIPALSTDNTTNWLLTKAPDLYLFASLLFAAPYLRDDSRVTMWEASVSKTITDMNRAAKKAMHGLSRLRTDIPARRAYYDGTTGT